MLVIYQESLHDARSKNIKSIVSFHLSTTDTVQI